MNSEVFRTKYNNILAKYGINEKFSPECIKQKSALTGGRFFEQKSRRVDLRGKTVFTVSVTEELTSECAFSIEKNDDGSYLLGIHIADVAEHIPYSSPVDAEAARRAKKCVFPDKVIGMIPERLEKEDCVFTLNKESAAVTVFLNIDENGDPNSIELAETIIKPCENCLTAEIEALYTIFDPSAITTIKQKYNAVLPSIQLLFELGGLLFSKKEEHGGTDYDPATISMKLSKDKESVEKIYSFKQNDAQRIIREFTSFAGWQLSKLFIDIGIPCHFRVRGGILPEKKDYLLDSLKKFGIDCNNIADNDLCAFIANKAHCSDNEDLIFRLLNDCLHKAEYSSEPNPHSLLGYDSYLRFAFPVYRYADLCIQRIMKEIIKCHGNYAQLNMELISEYTQAALKSSDKQLVQVKTAEYQIKAIYLLNYFNNRKNDKFSGTVYYNSNNEAFVFLDNTCYGKLKTVADREYVFGERINVYVVDADSDKISLTFEEINVSRGTF